MQAREFDAEVHAGLVIDERLDHRIVVGGAAFIVSEVVQIAWIVQLDFTDKFVSVVS